MVLASLKGTLGLLGIRFSSVHVAFCSTWRLLCTSTPNYPLRDPIYQLIETIKPSIEVHWRLLGSSCFVMTCCLVWGLEDASQKEESPAIADFTAIFNRSSLSGNGHHLDMELQPRGDDEARDCCLNSHVP